MSEPSKSNFSWWRDWLRTYQVEVVIIAFGLVSINLIFFAEAFRGHTIDRTAAGQLGDFVGGYIGTLLALTTVVLIVTTLKTQQRSSERQTFENKYFELIRMHRENVNELDLQDAKGRRIFVLILREFRAILPVVQEVAQHCGQQLSRETSIHIAYYCLYYGTGPNSSRMLRLSLAEFDQAFIAILDEKLGDRVKKKSVQAERDFGYVPFEGHQSRLGHYYRHLYQTVSYVDQQPFALAKYEYIKTIRAQLTTHEQALLLLNSLTPVGRNWWSKDLIGRYRLVQNLPRGFFEKTELDVSELFGPGYFEWEEAPEPAVEKQRHKSASG